MDTQFAFCSRLIPSLQVAKFAIEVVGLIGQSGAFYQNVIDSGAVKKLDHVKRWVALLVQLGYCLTFPSMVYGSLIHKTKLATNEDKKGTKEAAVQALKRINTAKFVALCFLLPTITDPDPTRRRLPRSPSIRNRSEAPLVNRSSVRINPLLPLREDVELSQSPNSLDLSSVHVYDRQTWDGKSDLLFLHRALNTLLNGIRPRYRRPQSQA